MELILKKRKAEAFVRTMDALGEKFNGIYIAGKLEDSVKLSVTNGKPILTFIGEVPEMVRIACISAFIDTLL